MKGGERLEANSTPAFKLNGGVLCVCKVLPIIGLEYLRIKGNNAELEEKHGGKKRN